MGLVAVLMLIALSLRVFYIPQLAVFLSDQAIDSFAVKDILSGDFTLLGPRASVGQFFNGPIVYYLMAPFYLIFGNDPLAGTIFQITLQIACMPLLYGLAKRFGGARAGLISLVIFTFSPLLISYSRATFNSYPAIFFITVILYVLTANRPTRSTNLIAGLFTGMLVQMHYFLYMYAFMYLVFVAFRDMRIHTSGIWKKKIRFVDCVYFLIGVAIGLAPFLLFELRHDFFNLRSIVTSGSAIGQSIDIWSRVGSVGVTITNLFGFSSGFVGLLSLICISIVIMVKKFEVRLKMLYVYSLTALCVCMIMYRGLMHNHYTIGFSIVFIVAFSCAVSRVVSSRLLAGLVLGYILWFIIISMTTGLYAVSKDHDGLGLIDQREAVSHIIKWKRQSGSPLSYNITQDTQQDNRAMPLRYLLSLENTVMQPLPVEDYGSNTELFLIAKRGMDLSKIRTWEVQSFGSKFTVTRRNVINDSYELFYLKKDH